MSLRFSSIVFLGTVIAVPELPEVETVRRELEGSVLGKRIGKIHFYRENLRYPLSPKIPKLFKGLRFERIGRRGKYLLFETDGAYTLIAHLGMSGNFTYSEHISRINELLPHRHVDVIFEGDSGLIYCDARRFGFIDFCATNRVEESRHFRRMGVEPLSTDFTGGYLHKRARGSRTPIKNFLLNQSHIAGIGNIYACEALWLSGISPKREAGRISLPRCESLSRHIVAVLRRAIDAGGSSMRDFRSASGDLGYFQHSWECYGREGLPCSRPSCRGVIRRISQSGRSSFYCSIHQR